MAANLATTVNPNIQERPASHHRAPWPKRWFPMKTAVSLVLAVASCFAQDANRMDQIVQSYAANQKFMGTALVARDGHVLFSKGYGSANLEWDIPNTPNTKFRLG